MTSTGLLLTDSGLKVKSRLYPLSSFLTRRFFAVKTAASLALGGKTLQIAALAIEAVLAPVFAGIAGDWVDRRYGWSPYGLLVGLVVGGLFCVQLLREVNRRMNKDESTTSKSNEH